MKIFKKIQIFLFLALLSNAVLGQVEYTAPLSSVLTPANAAVGLRVENKLLTHLVSGNEGGFTATDKWIGIGAPAPSLYGYRTQWAGQAFSKALRDVSGVKNAIIEWGNQGGEMQFRYITNPSDPVNGFRRIQTHTSAGNSYFGKVATFLTPRVGITADTNQAGLVAVTFNRYAGWLRTTQTASNTFGYGLVAQSFSNSNLNTNVSNYGVYAAATGNGTSNRNYGVYAIAGSNCANVNYAVYGNAPSNCTGSGTPASTNWAGFFQGDLFASGNTYFASDERLKLNVTPESNILPKLLELMPVNYKFDQAGAGKGLNLAGSLQHGLIAQKVQAIFPELVTNARYSIPGAEGESSSVEYLSVDYVRVVPLLLQGIKELEARVQRLEATAVAANTARGNTIETNGNTFNGSSEQKVTTSNGTFNVSDFKLSQNTPNPFSSETVIQYNLPTGVSRAQLAVFDLTGTLKMQFNNLSGNSRVVINGSALNAGMYIYSILVDGKEVMSKKMILTK